jgi:hypothetical protein
MLQYVCEERDLHSLTFVFTEYYTLPLLNVYSYICVIHIKASPPVAMTDLMPSFEILTCSLLNVLNFFKTPSGSEYESKVF